MKKIITVRAIMTTWSVTRYINKNKNNWPKLVHYRRGTFRIRKQTLIIKHQNESYQVPIYIVFSLISSLQAVCLLHSIRWQVIVRFLQTGKQTNSDPTFPERDWTRFQIQRISLSSKVRVRDFLDSVYELTAQGTFPYKRDNKNDLSTN